ncbi:EamA family transporter [Actinomadura logoneensis]|uniref:EamA family transporter n=1 Tax=Actinomadura logoneensis TaxID=2293572 RepID=A0A372JK54_9ACTN|nr:DMT family transporter [Actinomadura logoneensis]RFU39698.1 EamA family transporter [Actinomadura logoneensis]
MGELLALAAAVGFGTTHFLSGLLSRRVDATAVAFVAQLGGTLAALLAAPWFAAPHVTSGDLAWGVLSGVGTGVGVTFLYRALGEGDFSVVVPLSDVAAVALPVLAGVLLLSERPGLAAWLGMAAALPALYLVARPASGHGADTHAGKRDRGRGGASRPWTRLGGSVGTRDALVAGVAFAVQFIALARTGGDAGLWPLVASRVASVVAILPMASTMWREPEEPERQRVLASQPVWDVDGSGSKCWKPGRRTRGVARVRMSPALAAGALGTGVLGTVAMTLYLLATREQLMTLAVVLTALYPVIPVVLGLGVLRERVGRAQVAGLGLAAAAIALISLG